MENSNLTWGQMLLDNASSYAKLSNGIAVLHAIESHTSEKGHLGIKLTFANPAKLDDTSQRHYEYISLAQADRLNSTMEKMRYLLINANNAEATQAFAQLPFPFANVKDESGNDVYAENKEQIANLKASNPNIEFIPTDKSHSRYRAVKFVVDKAEFQSQLLSVLSMLKDTRYSLIFVPETDDNGDETGFMRLRTISEAKLSADAEE